MKKFIFGMLTIITFIPIAESLTEIICGWLETLKIETTKKVLIGNNEIADLQNQLEPISTQAIGFDYTPQQDYYDDDYEDDCCKKKNKIGFI